jgi:hypothetical protein
MIGWYILIVQLLAAVSTRSVPAVPGGPDTGLGIANIICFKVDMPFTLPLFDLSVSPPWNILLRSVTYNGHKHLIISGTERAKRRQNAGYSA